MLYVTASDGKLTKTHNYQITVINNDAGVFKLNDGVTLSVYHVVPVGYTRDGNDHHIVISKDTLYRQGASTILKFGVTTEEGCAYSGRDSFGTGGQLTVTAKDPDNKTTSHTLYCHKECSGEHKDTDANYVCDSCWMTLPKPGKLALTAVNQNGFIFEPVYVEYETGMTVMEVLESSGHTFAENGSFITSIDGQVDNYSLYYNNGAFDREAVIEDPANVTALWFTTYSGQGYSENLLRLVEQMAAFNASANGVKEYPAAKTAYEAAKKGFYAANETTAGTLYTNLKSAMDDYQAFLDAGTLPLTMEITLGSQAVTAGKAVFTSEFGTVYTFEDFTGVALKPAAYSFDISDGGFRHVRGTVVVEEGALLRAALPEGKWIGGLDIGILSGDNWKAVSKSNATDGSATFYVPDYATTSLYPYITRGEGVDGNSTHKVFLRSNTSARTWESKFTALAHVIEANSLEGTTLVLECIPAAAPADGYEQYQTFTVNIVRTPSLKDLGVSALGAELKLDFVNTTSNYLVKTSGDSVTVTPTALTSGAVITVNNTEVTSGQALEVDLTAITPQNGLYVIPVSVTANGRKTSYTVQVEKTDTVTVTLNVPNGVTAEVFNDAGAKIEGTNGVYRLDKDQTYTYIATFGEYYHATASFKAAEGEQVSVAAPKTENWLAALAAKAGTSGKAPLYPVEPGFDPQTHAYTAQVESNTESFYLQAYAISSAYSTEAIYQSHNNTVKSVYTDTGSTEHAKPGQSSDTYLSMPNFLGTGGWGNEMTVRVTQNTAESGVTYYQDYILTVGRDMTLYTLSAADTNGRNLQLAQLGSTAPGTFQKLVYDYTAKVSSAATSLNLSFKVSNTSRAFDFEAYTLEISGLQNPITFSNTDAVSREHTVAVPLNGTDEAETVTVTVRHSATGTVAGVYTIALTKLPAAAVRFIVDPADATVFVTDNTSGTRVLPESDGAYVLMSGENYTYVISKSGYITQNASFTASAQDIEITLEEAPASTLNDIAKDGDWLQFRADNNNNGVVDVMTPTAAEDAVLEWANKIGDGFDSGATGCPIIVDGYLYTYAGNSIHKINKDTGEIVDSGRMAASSSFAINSPTYAEGMIFVGLSDGRVQAFNAETLDSLWLFTDPLGGQPNCPIVYSDGYIYTGFWNSETKQANFIAIAVTDEDPTSAEETKLAAWSYTHNGFYWAGAYACEDFVLMGTDDGGDGYTSDYASILSVDPKSGLLLDELQLPNVGDQRSSICYDEDTDAYYFTTKGGDFYQVKVNADGTFTENSLRRLHLDNGANNQSLPPMSTSTPVIYNGRAYIGVSGTSQFGAYSGHNMTVIDLETFSIAYCVPTMGYPQTSGLLTTAYEDEEGYVYVYFIDNYTPGMIRVLRDKKGMTEVDHTYTTTSSYMENGVQKTMEGGYILFTPDGDEAQYAICSPVADSEGNLYFKNDSAKLMRLSSRMTSLEITQQPEKLVYCVGETFDSAGMTVTAHYANGTSKDITSYVSVTDEPLTADDTEITVSFAPDKMFVNEDTKTGGFWQWYQDANGAVGQTYYLPTATVTAQILTSHAWNDGEQTKAPTCAGEGNCLYTCTVCGATKNEPVAAVAHSTTKQEAQSATCLEPGIIAHYHCSGCGKNFADESGKTVLDTVVEPTKSHTLIKHAANASTCVGEGTVEYYACDVCHKNFADEAGTKELTTIVDPVTGHSMTKTEAKPASCAEAGNIAYYTCSVCKKNFADESGKTVLDSVAEPAKVHTLTGTEAKPATCTEEGNVAYYTCSGCGKNFADQQAERIIADVTLKAAGHKLKAVAAKEATYTAPGNVAYWSCETCGKLFADAKGKTPITDVVIPQLIRVEEDKATVSEAAVSNLIEEALTPEGGSTGTAQETVEVVIPVQDCTPENAVITSVELPVASVAELVETDKKIEGTVVLTINLGSATVKLDSKALEAVAEQVKGTSVTLILKDIPAEELTQEQQRTLDKYTVAMVITAELIGGDHTSVHDFKGGNVTVHLPFTPPAGTNGSDYTVLYVADDGTTEKIPTRYENGELVFTLKHFSDYAVALDVSDPSVPATGDAAPLAALTLMLLLSVTAFAVTLLSCKKRGA